MKRTSVEVRLRVLLAGLPLMDSPRRVTVTGLEVRRRVLGLACVHVRAREMSWALPTSSPPSGPSPTNAFAGVGVALTPSILRARERK